MPDDEPTQHTPKGHEIPVPKRADILRMFDNAAQPIDKPKKSRRRKPPKK
jgi:hypothetical protein